MRGGAEETGAGGFTLLSEERKREGLKRKTNGGRLQHYSHQEKGESRGGRGGVGGGGEGSWASHTLRIRKHMQWSSEGLGGERELEEGRVFFGVRRGGEKGEG